MIKVTKNNPNDKINEYHASLLAKQAADIDYIAMMSDIEIYDDNDYVENENEFEEEEE